MKKFLSTKGFTLVELLVVITIIAILATIGFTVFSGAGAKARDAKRKTDIDQIAKAYEVNYDPVAATYPILAPGNFTSGAIPTPPTTQEGTSYGNLLTTASGTYTVCTSLEGTLQSACSATSPTCYCRSAAQAGTTTTAAATPCANFNNLTVGQSQSCGSPTVTAGTYYVKCSDITASTICVTSSGCTFSGTYPYYSSATSTPSTGNFNLYRQGSGCTIPITVTLRN